MGLKQLYSVRVYHPLTLSALLLATPAWAEMQCFPRETAVKVLAAKFQEKVSEVGLAENGWLIELWKSPDGKTWTLLATSPDREGDKVISCGIANGTDWTSVPVKLGRAS